MVEHFGGSDPERLLKHPLAADAALQGVAQHLWLLEHFLLHVMAVVALANLAKVDLHLDRRPHHVGVLKVPDGEAVRLDLHEVPFLQNDEAVRNGLERQNVGGDVVFAYALADHQRAADAGCNQAVRVVPSQHGQGVGTLQALNRRAHRRQQGAALGEMEVDQVGENFRVRLRSEGVSRLCQLGAQRLEILDDAIVDDGDAPVGLVGMGVRFKRRPVGGPAGVGNADAPAHRPLGQLRHQFPHFAHLPAHLDAGAVLPQQANSGGVIASILQTLKTFQQNGADVAVANRAHNSAHASGRACQECLRRLGWVQPAMLRWRPRPTANWSLGT